MQLIGKSKIGQLRAKGIAYPQLRLPKSYSQAIGEIARIFETRHEGKQAFLIVTEHSMPSDDTVLKTYHEVLKPCDTVAHRAKEILVEDQPDCIEQSEAEKSLCTRIETFKSDTTFPALLRCSLRESRSAGPIRVRRRLSLRFENKDGEELFDQQKHRSKLAYKLDDDSSGVTQSLASLELYYTPEELESFLSFRLVGLSHYSLGWPRRAAAAFWECTQGRIDKARMEALRTYALDRFCSNGTQAKFLSYARAFLTYLTKTRLDSRYESFRLFLELPKHLARLLSSFYFMAHCGQCELHVKCKQRDEGLLVMNVGYTNSSSL
ncbi:MAG: hypothetical protein ABSB81_07215 [Halobacteriota archaeon]|jgi:hypothetical protein